MSVCNYYIASYIAVLIVVNALELQYYLHIIYIDEWVNEWMDG